MPGAPLVGEGYSTMEAPILPTPDNIPCIFAAVARAVVERVVEVRDVLPLHAGRY